MWRKAAGLQAEGKKMTVKVKWWRKAAWLGGEYGIKFKVKYDGEEKTKKERRGQATETSHREEDMKCKLIFLGKDTWKTVRIYNSGETLAEVLATERMTENFKAKHITCFIKYTAEIHNKCSTRKHQIAIPFTISEKKGEGGGTKGQNLIY